MHKLSKTARLFYVHTQNLTIVRNSQFQQQTKQPHKCPFNPTSAICTYTGLHKCTLIRRDSTDSTDSVATLRSAHTPRTATRDTTSTFWWKLPPQCPCPAGRRRTHWYLNRRALKGIREQDFPGFHRELGPSNTGRGAAKAW